MMNQPLPLQEKLTHLLTLMDDDSPEIQKILREEILSHGLDIILNKDDYISSLDGNDLAHFNQILDDLHQEIVFAAFSQLLDASLDEIDLEKSILLLSYWDKSQISCLKLRSLLDELADEVSQDMPHAGHPLGFIDHINKVLFQKYHFRGNAKDYYNPNNSYLHRIFETGLGIPISLSIIYILVAKRLNFPVFGVCMPAHFILKFDNGEDEIFFDPFYGGKVYSRQTCLDYMKGFTIDDPNEILEGCSTLEIVKRVLRNLYLNYSSHTPEPEKVVEIENLLTLLESLEQ